MIKNDEGKLSLTGTEKIYILGNNLELILKIMNFEISHIICDYTKYRMSFLEKEVCNYIPDIRKLGINDITEDEFYKLFGKFILNKIIQNSLHREEPGFYLNEFIIKKYLYQY